MKKALLALALAAFASNAMAAIALSPHDLSTAGANNTKYPNARLSSCQYCHAPHRSNTAVTGAPLWNRSAPTTVFTMYTSTTFNGTATVPGTNSLTCLSCHDGITDMGATFTGTAGFLVRTPMNSATAVVGQDLTNDHPVGMRYPAATDTTYVTAATVTGIKLYGTAGNQTVECGSCHDPHNADWDNLPGGPSFLRVSATQICSRCHLK